jgi:peptidyl-prolyl cis-trans isomerase SurA
MLGGTTSFGWAAPAKTKEPESLKTEVVIDTVVAAVDEKPITLKELQARLSPPRKMSLKDISSDHEAQQTLDAIIAERVFEAEAASKRVSVADEEVDEYINEVAARNSLSRQDFEAVLKREGKSLDWYKRQVRTEITKTKLASSITRGGVSVSEQEIDEYIKDNPSSRPEGAAIKLRMISISALDKSQEDLAAKVKAVEDALAAGDSFGDVAKKFSEGAHASEGGLLGVLAEKDLSSNIFDAVLSIDEGEHSKAVTSDDSTQFFFVEERIEGSDDSDEETDNSEARRDEARKAIQRRKTEEKVNSYFSTELEKNHSIDKKF